MTRGEMLKKLLDSGFPVISGKRLQDNTGDRLCLLGDGVVITRYDHGGYSVSGNNYPATIDAVNTIVAILKKEVVRKETDTITFGGIIGVGV